MKSLTIPAKPERLDEITAFVDEELEAYDCPMNVQLQIELAIEEIFVNISSYAYHPVDGEAEVRCEVLQDPLRVVIQFLDGGKPYDPLAREDADISQEALEEREGGLGILLVKKTMDDVQYAYENGKNILTILKKL
ncbi:MAG: ATP-binding protein [Oscillospiraceae bacterium]|nr:ATP-binding protein [Oscillospiraceae bacterium]